MLYSYYFDLEKTHRLDMEFEILNFVVVDNSNSDLLFNLKITEVIDNEELTVTNKVGTFSFTTDDNFDIDFNRIRIQNKWIFTAINNKKPDEEVSVVFISELTNINPLGLDVINSSKGYTADLKGNTLAILEQNYIPPES